MKKIFTILFLITATAIINAQTLNIQGAADWNKLRESGFFESYSAHTQNTPNKAYDLFFGINIAHSPNKVVIDKPYHWGGQIAFGINRWNEPAAMYVRTTNEQGEGPWAKVLVSKGNQVIAGKLTIEEIEVKIPTGADFVFNEDYKLPSLSQVESHIKEYKHLPEIPSEKQMQKEGLNMSEFQIKLLQKIEELTLYVIQQDKEITKLKEQVNKNTK